MSDKKKVKFPFGWVSLVIVLMGLLMCYLYSQRFKGEQNIYLRSDAVKLLDKRENDSTVNAYITFVKEANGKMSLDHAYSNEALLKLSAAVNAMAKAAGYTVMADIDAAEADANKIIRDPMAINHADNIRKVATILSGTLSNMQREKYPSLLASAEKVKQAASNIEPDLLTLDQKNKVKTFFEQAAELLNKMN